MLSGLFDIHLDLTIILGHRGEGLPFTLPRLEHRLSKQRDGIGRGNAQRPVSHYLNENFRLTTSGHFHTRTLYDALGEIGADRVLFSVDCRYESMQDAAGWFDPSLLSHNDRQKVGRDNAARIFDLRTPSGVHSWQESMHDGPLRLMPSRIADWGRGGKHRHRQ